MLRNSRLQVSKEERPCFVGTTLDRLYFYSLSQTLKFIQWIYKLQKKEFKGIPCKHAGSSSGCLSRSGDEVFNSTSTSFPLGSQETNKFKLVLLWARLEISQRQEGKEKGLRRCGIEICEMMLLAEDSCSNWLQTPLGTTLI
jgi:hypothetical protein